MEQNLYNYEIKRGKDILFNFAFIKLEEEKYRLVYNLYFDKVEKYFKNNEVGLLAKGYIARILSGFHNTFKIQPLNESQGFDFNLDIEFSGKIVESAYIDVFKEYHSALKNILKKLKIVLTRDNINAIINMYQELDNNIEQMIVLDGKTNKVHLIDNSQIKEQDSTTLGVYLTDRDLLEIERMSRPIIVHNHQSNLTFSKEDYVVYDKLKELIKKKFLFMVYNVKTQELKEIKTGTIFS